MNEKNNKIINLDKCITEQVFNVEEDLKKFDEYDELLQSLISNEIENPDFLNIRQLDSDIDYKNCTTSQKRKYSILMKVEEFQEELLEIFAIEKAIQLAEKIKSYKNPIELRYHYPLTDMIYKELEALTLLHYRLCHRSANPIKYNTHHIYFNEVNNQSTCLIYTNYLKHFNIVYEYIYTYVIHSFVNDNSLRMSARFFNRKQKDILDGVELIHKDQTNNEFIKTQIIFTFMKLINELFYITYRSYPTTKAISKNRYEIVRRYFVDHPVVDNLKYQVSDNTLYSAKQNKNAVQYLKFLFRQALVNTIKADDCLDTFFYCLFKTFEKANGEISKQFKKDVNMSRVFMKYMTNQMYQDFMFFRRSQDLKDYSFIEIVKGFINGHNHFVQECDNIFILDEVLESFRFISSLTNETRHHIDSQIDDVVQYYIDKEVLSKEYKAWYHHYHSDIYNDLFSIQKKPL